MIYLKRWLVSLFDEVNTGLHEICHFPPIVPILVIKLIVTIYLGQWCASCSIYGLLYCINFLTCEGQKEKGKSPKILNSEENWIGKSLIKWQNQMTKHIKRMNNNCHIPHLVQAFSNVENRIHIHLVEKTSIVMKTYQLIEVSIKELLSYTSILIVSA